MRNKTRKNKTSENNYNQNQNQNGNGNRNGSQNYDYIGKNYFIKNNEIIEKGNFSIVRKGYNDITGEEVAIKIIELLDDDGNVKDFIKTEIEIMKLMNHKYIVKYKDIVYDKKDKIIYLIIEYLEGGQLFDYIEKNYPTGLPEEDAKCFFIQILAGLNYCHLRCIAHRDLKLENILLNKERDTIKLIDFGLSEITKDKNKTLFFSGQTGSPDYFAPELWTSDGEYKLIPVDIWALGIILYLMVMKEFPFHLNTTVQNGKYSTFKDLPVIISRMEKNEYKTSPIISQECWNLIHNLLQSNPSERITMDGILKHPWIKDHPNMEIFKHNQLEKYIINNPRKDLNEIILNKMKIELGIKEISEEDRKSILKSDTSKISIIYGFYLENKIKSKSNWQDEIKLLMKSNKTISFSLYEKETKKKNKIKKKNKKKNKKKKKKKKKKNKKKEKK